MANKNALIKGFEKEKTVRMLVPKDPYNPKELTMKVFINCKGYIIPRGKMVELPETIANVVQDSLARTQELDSDGSDIQDLG